MGCLWVALRNSMVTFQDYLLRKKWIQMYTEGIHVHNTVVLYYTLWYIHYCVVPACIIWCWQAHLIVIGVTANLYTTSAVMHRICTPSSSVYSASILVIKCHLKFIAHAHHELQARLCPSYVPTDFHTLVILKSTGSQLLCMHCKSIWLFVIEYAEYKVPLARIKRIHEYRPQLYVYTYVLIATLLLYKLSPLINNSLLN